MLLENMTAEAYIASRFFEPSISQAALRVTYRKCRIHVLHSARLDKSTSQQIDEKTALAPETARIFRRIAEDPLITLKEAGLHFSFVVVDEKTVGVEIIDTGDTSSFFLALQFEDKIMSAKLIEYFKEIEQNGVEDRRKRMMLEQSATQSGSNS
jgi:hypothetical protein